jgi:hypothetical protein
VLKGSTASMFICTVSNNHWRTRYDRSSRWRWSQPDLGKSATASYSSSTEPKYTLLPLRPGRWWYLAIKYLLLSRSY